jgi:hypothetical protein
MFEVDTPWGNVKLVIFRYRNQVRKEKEKGVVCDTISSRVILEALYIPTMHNFKPQTRSKTRLSTWLSSTAVGSSRRTRFNTTTASTNSASDSTEHGWHMLFEIQSDRNIISIHKQLKAKIYSLRS